MPSRLSLLLSVSFVLAAHGGLVGAQVLLADAAPTREPVNLEQAEKLIASYAGRSEDLEVAAAAVARALANNPDDARALTLQGRLYIEAGTNGTGWMQNREYLEAATKSLERATQIDPSLLRARMSLGTAYAYADERAKAIEQFSVAQALDPKNPEVDLAYAFSAAQWGEWGDVESKLAAAKKKMDAQPHPDPLVRARSLRLRIRVDLQLNRKAAADADFRQLLRLRPDSAWDHGNYATHLLVVGKTDSALREATTAVELMPYGRGFHTLGLAHYAKWAVLKDSNPQVAAQHLAKAMEYVPDKNIAMGEALADENTNSDMKALAAALKSEGVSVDAVDHNGDTALSRAVEGKNVGKANSLMDSGADPNVRDAVENIPLAVAIANRDQAMLDTLIAHHANLELADEFGRRPLHLAVLANDIDMAHALVSHGADVNARGFKEWTPLMVAVQQKNSLPIVKMLTEAGADLSLNADGQTAADLADGAGNSEAAQWLRARTAQAK